MNIISNSLVEFEKIRSSNMYVPPVGSNSFFTIGNGSINLYTYSNNPKFKLFIESGDVETGLGMFNISHTSIYTSMDVNEGSSLSVTDRLSINSSVVDIFGTLNFKENSNTTLNNAILKLNSSSILDLTSENIKITQKASSIRVNGTINISFNNLHLLSNELFIINPSCEINVSGISLENREFSLTDYVESLKNKSISKYTNGQISTNHGTMGYTWVDGDFDLKSQILDINILSGEVILGDFKFRSLGRQNKLIRGRQFISDIVVKKNAKLYISDEFKGYNYHFPELYLGFILFNNKRSASCTVHGTLEVSGSDSKLVLDTKSSLIIKEGASLIVKNGANIINANIYSTNELIRVDGLLILDDISQIKTFNDKNITIGEKGKVVIKNPTEDRYKTLLNIPTGIKTSDLYRLFGKRLDKVEFHISKNTGIKIDKYFESYSRDMINWYNGLRFEKAVFEKMLIWSDGGVIELDNKVIPWVNEDCSLLDAAKLFKSKENNTSNILQEVVNRLVYIGCGDIVFRFIKDANRKDVKLELKPIVIKSTFNKPLTDIYVIDAEGEGNIYLKNSITKLNPEEIISQDSKHYNIKNGKNNIIVK